MKRNNSSLQEEKEEFRIGMKYILKDIMFTSIRASDKSEEYYSSKIKSQRLAEKKVDEIVDIASHVVADIVFYLRVEKEEMSDEEMRTKLLDYCEEVSHKIHAGEIKRKDAIKEYMDARKK